MLPGGAIIMKIAVIPGSDAFLNDRFFTDTAVTAVRDNVLAYAAEFKNAAEERGWTVGTFDRIRLERDDMVLAINFEEFPEEILSALDIIDSRHLIAVVREPPGIAPVYYDPAVQECFGRFYVPKIPEKGEPCRYLSFPVAPGDRDAWIPFESKKLLVSITSGKLVSFDGELYSERIRAILHFQKAAPDGFDMYGQGWETDTLFGFFSPHRLFSSYRGPVASKHETFKRYRFSICYENCDNVEGYVSEKIYDSMKAGCVPIYLGAPDIRRYVPKECFIDKREFSTYPELEKFIRNMGRQEYSRYIDAISAFLDSPVYRERLPGRYAQRLLAILEESKGDRSGVPSPEGVRKLSQLCALKKIRKGGMKEKIIGFKAYLSVSKRKEWFRLFDMALNFLALKLRIFNVLVWWKIKRIRLGP